jgi:hypothetical protein
MMPVGEQEGDGRQLVHREACEILESLDFAPEPTPMPSASIIRHLRKNLVMTHGYGWLKATYTEHTLPDGQRAFTAARRCARCGEIETFIVTISDDGELVFACPLEDA